MTTYRPQSRLVFQSMSRPANSSSPSVTSRDAPKSESSAGKRYSFSSRILSCRSSAIRASASRYSGTASAEPGALTRYRSESSAIFCVLARYCSWYASTGPPPFSRIVRQFSSFRRTCIRVPISSGFAICPFIPASRALATSSAKVLAVMA